MDYNILETFESPEHGVFLKGEIRKIENASAWLKAGLIEEVKTKKQTTTKINEGAKRDE